MIRGERKERAKDGTVERPLKLVKLLAGVFDAHGKAGNKSTSRQKTEKGSRVAPNGALGARRELHRRVKVIVLGEELRDDVKDEAGAGRRVGAGLGRDRIDDLADVVALANAAILCLPGAVGRVKELRVDWPVAFGR